MKRTQQSMGLFWIMLSLAWVIVGLLGLFFGRQWLVNWQASIENAIDLADTNLADIHTLVQETQDVLTATGQSLSSLEVALEQLTVLMDDLRPVIWDVSDTLTVTVPDALDEIQAAMPTVIETAHAVDQTLSWLSGFQITIPNLFGDDWQIDLGVDYDPEVPLDDALAEVSGSLDGVPETLRAMEPNLTDVDLELLRLKLDLQTMNTDLDAANTQLGDINPQLNELQVDVESLQITLQDSRARIAYSFQVAQGVWTGLMVLLILSQVPPVYLAWNLLMPSSGEEIGHS